MVDDDAHGNGDPPLPRLVGRDRELAAVTAAIRTVIGGRGGGLVLRGNHGSGRTRLLEAALQEEQPYSHALQVKRLMSVAIITMQFFCP
jgi:hypothetical protein